MLVRTGGMGNIHGSPGQGRREADRLDDINDQDYIIKTDFI